MSATIRDEGDVIVVEIVPDLTAFNAAMDKARRAFARFAAAFVASPAARAALERQANQRRSAMHAAYRRRQRSHHRRNR